ncbi:hypothetical protein [Burkholderia multivorans]|uniref:hypothetical protein n=1 Tax=Burkholderia multivorans TaxID=87883 RepID=UPI0021599DCB|nr:hypothetical protein [Burkholderia multivorans]
MGERYIKRPERVKRAMEQLWSAFVDCTINAPEALALHQYVTSLEKAARRTTPDREAIIEECAKVCEMERDALRKNEAVWDANPNLRPDEDYVSEWEASACRGEEYAAAIRALKTAPTSDKGGA